MKSLYLKIIQKISNLKRKVCRFIDPSDFYLPDIIAKPKNSILRGVNVGHVCAFTYGNAGDALLPVAIRDFFMEEWHDIKNWTGMDVHRLVTPTQIRYFNRKDFLIIGGGGLFLRDTCPNEISGWQWNCSIEAMQRIKVPIIAFAIGYNRFRSQEDFKPIFIKHLNAFVEKCAFVGIRNHGSIESLKPYLLTDALREKLVYQPCLTTLIAQIYPSFVDYEKKEDFVAFNCAFDRQVMRGVNDIHLYSIARTALELSRYTNIKYYSHMDSDKKALTYFDELGVEYELVELHDVGEIIKQYSLPRLVIGMRGHAQMIPFGCQTPILSIISHDKMQWFLDDIHHSDWGVDVLSSGFGDELSEKALDMYKNFKDNIKEIQKSQMELWNITLGNMKQIKSAI